MKIRANGGKEPSGVDGAVRLAAYLSGLSQVYRAIRHETAGTLNTIHLELELIERSPGTEADPAARQRLARHLGTIRAELRRLHGTIERVFRHTRLDFEPGAPFDLREVVSDLEALLRPYGLEHQVRLEVSLPDRPMHLEGDRGAFEQALFGLVLHSLDGVRNGGELALGAATRDGAATLTVIARRTRSDPHAALPATAYAGDGLALSVARDVFGAHGGTLREVAGPDTGYEVELPLPGPPT